MIEAAGLEDDFATISPFTAFGATNGAFQNDIGDDYVNMLITDEDYGLHLNSLVLNHGTDEGSYTSGDIFDGQRIVMLSGEAIDVVANGTGIYLDTFAARLDLTDEFPVSDRVDAIGTNGVLHEVDTVVTPAWYFIDLIEILDILSSRFSILTDLIVLAGLEDDIANTPNTTLAAPTNAAFDALPEGMIIFLRDPANVETLQQVLLYHLIPTVINFAALDLGETEVSTVQGGDITITVERANDGSLDVFFNDAEASIFFLTQWSIMYQLDSAMMPPGFGGEPTPSITGPPATTGTPVPSTAPIAGTTLLDIIQGDENFSTLQAAVIGADLESFLNSNEFPSTLFAPPNDAFGVIDQDYLAKLLTPDYNLHLLSLVYYHVLFDKVLSMSQMQDGDVLTFLNQLEATVARSGEDIALRTSSVEFGDTPPINVVTSNSDIVATNGLIHEVDTVIRKSQQNSSRGIL